MSGRICGPWRFRQVGLSLLELLVILSIVAVLAVGSSLLLSNKQSGAARALMDDIEGAIANAHQAAMAGGRDTAIACWGAWDKDNPMRIAYGDSRILTQNATGQASFIKIAKEVLDGNPPTATTPAVAVADVSLADQQSVAVPFQYSPADSTQRRAMAVISGSDAWDKSVGGSDRIETVVPFTTEFLNVLDDNNDFCKGQSNSLTQVSISGYTKRFTRTVFIRVVTTGSSGAPISGAPMGLLVLLEGSATVFKFYNPGTDNGDGKWRRI